MTHFQRCVCVCGMCVSLYGHVKQWDHFFVFNIVTFQETNENMDNE